MHYNIFFKIYNINLQPQKKIVKCTDSVFTEGKINEHNSGKTICCYDG